MRRRSGSCTTGTSPWSGPGPAPSSWWARTTRTWSRRGCWGEYDGAKNAAFRSFAELCITRQILTAIKGATRKKHQPLNTYVSLNQPVYEPGSTDRTLLDVLSGMGVSDPEEMLIGQENMEAMARDIQEKLSPLEKQVLGLYLKGLSYQQIGQLLQKPPKSIDNAIQRVKKKLEEHVRTA